MVNVDIQTCSLLQANSDFVDTIETKMITV
jgi:hypothetical protein